MPSDTYEILEEILKTGEVNHWNYPEYVRDIIPASNPSSTKIIIAFEEDNDFLETLGVGQNMHTSMNTIIMMLTDTMMIGMRVMF
jgi:hypothetical protein